MAKKFLALVPLVILASMALGSGPKEYPIYVVKADWQWESIGLSRSVPCDPPAPKDSSWSCAEAVKAWRWHCPTGAVDVLPHERADAWRQDGEKHDDTWCLIIREQSR